MIRVPPQRGGCIEVVCGSMFSGKTEELLRRVKRARLARQRVIVFKPRIDNRYDEKDVIATPGFASLQAGDRVGGALQPRARARRGRD